VEQRAEAAVIASMRHSPSSYVAYNPSRSDARTRRYHSCWSFPESKTRASSSAIMLP
jgi:hypothetical protein